MSVSLRVFSPTTCFWPLNCRSTMCWRQSKICCP
jgi:hypothetical protein